MLQGGDLFGLFEQNGKQDGLEGQERIALADGGDVVSGGGEDAVEEVLVTLAKGAPKGRKHGFGLVQVLGDGGNGSSHESSGEERWLGYGRKWLGKKEDQVSAVGEALEQEGFLFEDVRLETDGERRRAR